MLQIVAVILCGSAGATISRRTLREWAWAAILALQLRVTCQTLGTDVPNHPFSW